MTRLRLPLALLVSAVAAGFLAAALFDYFDVVRGIADHRATHASVIFGVAIGALVVLTLAQAIREATAWGFIAGSGAAALTLLVVAHGLAVINPAEALLYMLAAGITGAVCRVRRARKVAPCR